MSTIYHILFNPYIKLYSNLSYYKQLRIFIYNASSSYTNQISSVLSTWFPNSYYILCAISFIYV